MSAQQPSYQRIVDTLVDEFDDRVARCREVATRCVTEEVARFDDAPVRQFLEILVHKAARERLADRSAVP